MTNFQKWQFYTKDLTSPQEFIDVGFYYMIGASLQRRVWTGATDPRDSGALFPNTYIYLVGPPACGKGLVIKRVNDFLRYWERDPVSREILPKTDKVSGASDNAQLPIFALKPGPDATSYEKLIQKLATSSSVFEYPAGKPCIHSSVFFALEELSSLFQINVGELPKFLLNGYDCGDYRRETITRGVDQVKRSCVNILAGTTTSFLEEIFSETILTDGLSSRCWFIYAFGPRSHKWETPKLTPEQQQARLELLDHLKEVIQLSGEVVETAEAREYLIDWYENVQPSKRANNDIRLASYYGRKKVHVKKLCMQMLFAEQTTSFEVTLDIARAAVAFFEGVEPRMHHALTFGGKNPFASVGAKILQYIISLPSKRATTKELLSQFWQDVRELELKEVLRYLHDTNKITFENDMATLLGAVRDSTGKIVQFPHKTSDPVKGKIPGADLPALPLPEKKTL